MDEMKTSSGYESLIESVGTLLDAARIQIATSVNTVLVQTYWNIGKYIVEFEQGGALSHFFSWSHYYEILKSDDPLEISFYTKECGPATPSRRGSCI